MTPLLSLLAAFALADRAWTAGRAWPGRLRLGAVVAAAGLVAVALATLPGAALLQKVIGYLIMPAGLLWAGLLAAAAVAWHRRSWGWAGLLLGAAVLYGAAGNAWLGARLLGSLEAPYAPVRPETAEPFDAVLVLGGGTYETGDGHVYLQAGGDRVMMAARLYHAGRTPLLVASGSDLPGRSFHHDGAAATARLWRDLGVPRTAILQIPEPHNTREEIRAYAELVERRGWGRVGLVTSAWHLRRALALAEKEGLTLVPIPADFRGEAHWDGLASVVPTGAGFDAVHRAMWERVGMAVGR